VLLVRETLPLVDVIGLACFLCPYF
jgi:hypothetical protein